MGGKEKVATTAIVQSVDEALKMVEAEKVDSLVFISRSMILEAREIKKEHPRINVVVLTGLIPDDEVRIVDKGWLGLNLKQLLKAITIY